MKSLDGFDSPSTRNLKKLAITRSEIIIKNFAINNFVEEVGTSDFLKGGL